MSVDPRQQLQQVSMLRGTQPSMAQQSQPIQDPRSQALQQYMRMKGMQAPNIPTQSMTLPEQADAVDHMTESSEDAKYDENGQPIDNGAYFRHLPENDDASDRELDEEIQRDAMRKPSYVDNRGNASPNENYTDEDLLQMLSTMIGNQRR